MLLEPLAVRLVDGPGDLADRDHGGHRRVRRRSPSGDAAAGSTSRCRHSRRARARPPRPRGRPGTTCPTARGAGRGSRGQRHLTCRWSAGGGEASLVPFRSDVGVLRGARRRARPRPVTPIGYTLHQRATVLRYLRAWGTSLESDPDIHAHVPEEAKAPVPQQQTSPSDPTSSQPDPSSDFGANEWLVEEMYDQFTRDPGSVDPTWVAYFKKSGSGNGSSSANGTAPAETKTVATAPAEKPAAAAPVEAPPVQKAPASRRPPTPATKPAPRRPRGRTARRPSRPRAPIARCRRRRSRPRPPRRATSRRTPCCAARPRAPSPTWTTP